MKRQNDRAQLRREEVENSDNDEEDEDNNNNGFVKASQEVISSRKIIKVKR